MTRVSGPLQIVTPDPVQVSGVWVRAEETRPHGDGIMLDGNGNTTIVDGVVSFTAAPGPAVMTITTMDGDDRIIDLLIPDESEATLARVKEDADLAKGVVKDGIDQLVAQLRASIDGVINAAVGDIKWERRDLVSNEDLNGVTTQGGYNARTWGIANSLVNRPPGTVERAKVNVYNNGTALWQEWLQLDAANVPTTTFTRRRDATGTWSPWEKGLSRADIEAALRTLPTLPSGANLDSYTTFNTWSSGGFSNHATIVNKPSWLTQPAVYRILPTGVNGVVFQQAIGWSADGTTLQAARHSVNGKWGEWKDETAGAGLAAEEASWSPADGVYFWGDSLVRGSQVGGQWELSEALPAKVGEYITNPVTNYGISGQRSNEILLRSGALIMTGTPAGGKIPASGNVAVDIGGQWVQASSSRTFGVTWAGVTGTLAHQGDETWEFRRSTSGTAVTVSEPTPMYSTQAPAYGVGTHVFIMGENDFWSLAITPDTDIVTHVVAAYARAVESIPADPVRHVLIAGVKCKSTTVKGDERYRQVKEINRRLAARFPDNFIDREAWLASRGLAAAGITPTAADREAMAAGITPPSLYAPDDDLHIRKDVVAAEARELWAPALARRGWAHTKTGVTLPAPWTTSSVDLWTSRDDLSALHHYSGTGFPEGKVAAPVGTIYTDTAATNGAVRWIKATGTGATGWKVQYGDTGWRVLYDSTSEYLDKGRVLIRREAGQVYVVLDEVETKGKTNNESLGRFPAGFRGTGYSHKFAAYTLTGSTPVNAINLSSLGYVNMYGTKTAGTPVYASTVLSTTEAWPTTLPGTPA